MNWTKPKDSFGRYIASEDGAFYVNKAHVFGEPVYQAVRVIPPPARIVLGRGTLAEAKQACEEAA